MDNFGILLQIKTSNPTIPISSKGNKAKECRNLQGRTRCLGMLPPFLPLFFLLRMYAWIGLWYVSEDYLSRLQFCSDIGVRLLWFCRWICSEVNVGISQWLSLHLCVFLVVIPICSYLLILFIWGELGFLVNWCYWWKWQNAEESKEFGSCFLTLVNVQCCIFCTLSCCDQVCSIS